MSSPVMIAQAERIGRLQLSLRTVALIFQAAGVVSGILGDWILAIYLTANAIVLAVYVLDVKTSSPTQVPYVRPDIDCVTCRERKDYTGA